MSCTLPRTSRLWARRRKSRLLPTRTGATATSLWRSFRRMGSASSVRVSFWPSSWATDRRIGKNRAIAVVTACEFGKRFRKTAPEEKPVLKDAVSVGNYMMPQLEDLDVEEFWALFLNPKHEMLRRVRICRGEVSENAADPRNIMRFGVLYNATYIVTVHNHISGNPSPTKFDSIIAARLKTAAEAVRMTLRDHIILAEERYFSFKENKKL